MSHVQAYQTVKQELYFGDQTRLIDFSPKVNAVNVPSQVRMVPRIVLNRIYPLITVTRVDYRLQCQQLLVDSETDGLRVNPSGIVVLRQTDSNRAMSYEAVVAGIPEQAAAEGEIVGPITFQPTGQVYESSAGHELPFNSASGAARIVVVTGAGGEYVRAGSTTQLGVGIHVLPATGAIQVNGEGFLFNRTKVAV